MSWFDDITDKAFSDIYLQELLCKAEILYTYNFLLLDNSTVLLSEKEFVDLLRFADILCRSNKAAAKNKAYKIISLLHEEYHAHPYFNACANTVLTKLGNFPAMDLIAASSTFSSIETTLEKTVKEVYQESPFQGKIFTDAQYRLFETLKNSNHFSFSGPTSFGKSFIIESFINYIIHERNGIDNIVVLVPTRALINQVSQKLKADIRSANYKVLTHPIVPTLFNKEGQRYIFVFTPERWISYIANKENPVITYMFVDEAHKIISKKDSRAPLYYHAILLAERKSINLYFASPNIPNAEIFLKLFEKSQDETMIVEDTSVSQNRYFFDLLQNNALLFSDTGDEITLPFFNTKSTVSAADLLLRLGKNHKNIIYCNTITDTIQFALNFSTRLPLKNNKEIHSLIKLVKNNVHTDYFLLDCLKHGVAFHFSRLPQQIREEVERLFSGGVLDYVFCTSTLLEGINLPAKNIFIFNNAIGLSKFTDIDFWNLAGRAGRLNKEMSGNIICVRASTKRNRWDNLATDLLIIKSKTIKPASPIIINGQGHFYDNLSSVIQNKPFTKKNCTENEKLLWKHYANILYVHQISNNDSILINSFLKKHTGSQNILNHISKNNNIPAYILEQSTTINPKYQNAIWNHSSPLSFPNDTSSNSCEIILSILYDTYNWAVEESGGQNPMTKTKSRIRYFAVLMSSWISGYQLSTIIANTIKYYSQEGTFYINREETPFDANNRAHINEVINTLMGDIDTALRFKIKNYILNYSLICSEKHNNNTLEKWVNYIEYGTTDSAVIALQTLGLSRHLANFIIKHHSNCIQIQNDEITAFNHTFLLQNIDTSEHLQEYNELINFFQ